MTMTVFNCFFLKYLSTLLSVNWACFVYYHYQSQSIEFGPISVR